jgi:hyperosmotically inducible protein
MTATAHSRRAGRLALAAAVALGGLALAGCNRGAPSDDRTETAGNALDDSVITTKVKSALVAQTQGKGGGTSVSTRHGEVLLSGFVDDQAQADKEVQLARGVDGVKSVDSKLMVKNGPSTAGNNLDDSVITVKVKSALMTDAQTRSSQIAVATDKGVVQLSGFVGSADEQARAAVLARGVQGVRDVVDATALKK